MKITVEDIGNLTDPEVCTLAQLAKKVKLGKLTKERIKNATIENAVRLQIPHSEVYAWRN